MQFYFSFKIDGFISNTQQIETEVYNCSDGNFVILKKFEV